MASKISKYKQFLFSVFGEQKKIIFIVMGVFILGVIIGSVSLSYFKEVMAVVLISFYNIIGRAETSTDIAQSILGHNIRAFSILFLSGVIIVGPLIIVYFNGFLVGLILAGVYRINDLFDSSFTMSVFSLVPHGIFELSGLFLGAALSMTFFSKLYFQKHIYKKESFWQLTRRVFLGLFIIVLPLFMIAAVIETYISPLFLPSQTKGVNLINLNSQLDFITERTEKPLTFSEFASQVAPEPAENITFQIDKRILLFTIYPWIFLEPGERDQLKKVMPQKRVANFYQLRDGNLLGIILTEHESDLEAEQYSEFIANWLVTEQDLIAYEKFLLGKTVLVKNKQVLYLLIKTAEKKQYQQIKNWVNQDWLE